jgi:hypothetical protein
MNAYADLTTLKSGAYANLTLTTNDTYLRQLLEDASRLIDKYCMRHFYCWEGKKYYDGDDDKLFIDDLLSVTTLKCDPGGDGTFENSYTANTDYLLYPLNDYPKTRIDLGYSAAYSDFAKGIPRGIELDGVHGYGDGVSATPYIDSGVTVNTGGIDATTLTHALATGKGASFAIGQTIRIESEQLYITGISTDTLTFLGQPTRGRNGTTAAIHAAGKAIYIYQYPMPIVEACLITCMRAWKRKDSAFQDTVGIPDLGTVIAKKGLDPDVVERIAHYVKVRSSFA